MAYTTKANVQDYLALTIKTEVDSFLNLLFSFAKEYIDLTTGHNYDLVTEETEASAKKYDGNGQPWLQIDDCTEVESVTIDGFDIGAVGESLFTYPANATPKTSIQLNNTRLRNSRSQMTNNIFVEGQQNVVVTAKWGCLTVPAVITLAATKLVGAVIKEAIGDKDVRELTSETLADYSASFAKVTEIADRVGVTEMLKPYTRTIRKVQKPVQV